MKSETYWVLSLVLLGIPILLSFLLSIFFSQFFWVFGLGTMGVGIPTIILFYLRKKIGFYLAHLAMMPMFFTILPLGTLLFPVSGRIAMQPAVVILSLFLTFGVAALYIAAFLRAVRQSNPVFFGAKQK
ncbi:MAG: hypothetical protein JW772_01960 [Candidatus Diapherotrites archaeon]|nr:hypothetical protein [Candidatus Diapherotrites archaeon]